MSDAEINDLKERRARTLSALNEGDLEESMRGNLEFYDAVCRGARSAYLGPLLQGVWLRLGPVYSLILNRFIIDKGTLESGKALLDEVLDGFEARDKSRVRKAIQALIASNVNLAMENTEIW